MLDKSLARTLLPVVNDPSTHDLIMDYAKYRQNLLRTELENLTDINDILRVQGQIKELKRIFTLKEEVNKDSK